MNQVFKLSEELNRALLDSAEYRQYVNALQAVKEKPELYQAMNDYRRKNRHVQMYASDETIFDETNHLVEEYEQVLKNDAVAEFLAVEQKVVRMMQQMYVILGNHLEFDDNYMEGQVI